MSKSYILLIVDVKKSPARQPRVAAGAEPAPRVAGAAGGLCWEKSPAFPLGLLVRSNAADAFWHSPPPSLVPGLNTLYTCKERAEVIKTHRWFCSLCSYVVAGPLPLTHPVTETRAEAKSVARVARPHEGTWLPTGSITGCAAVHPGFPQKNTAATGCRPLKM